MLGMKNIDLSQLTYQITISEGISAIDLSAECSKPKPIKLRGLLKRLVKKKMQSNPKITASVLTITLGIFGAHRIYLGTNYTVPIFYTLTLGGGLGILPLSDLILILTTKDISKYYDNPSIFMWDTDS